MKRTLVLPDDRVLWNEGQFNDALRRLASSEFLPSSYRPETRTLIHEYDLTDDEVLAVFAAFVPDPLWNQPDNRRARDLLEKGDDLTPQEEKELRSLERQRWLDELHGNR